MEGASLTGAGLDHTQGPFCRSVLLLLLPNNLEVNRAAIPFDRISSDTLKLLHDLYLRGKIGASPELFCSIISQKRLAWCLLSALMTSARSVPGWSTNTVEVPAIPVGNLCFEACAQKKRKRDSQAMLEGGHFHGCQFLLILVLVFLKKFDQECYWKMAFLTISSSEH